MTPDLVHSDPAALAVVAVIAWVVYLASVIARRNASRKGDGR